MKAKRPKAKACNNRKLRVRREGRRRFTRGRAATAKLHLHAPRMVEQEIPPFRKDEHSTAPRPWPSVRHGVKRVLAPVERFLAIEAASGILLMIAEAVALGWANSPWRSRTRKESASRHTNPGCGTHRGRTRIVHDKLTRWKRDVGGIWVRHELHPVAAGFAMFRADRTCKSG